MIQTSPLGILVSILCYSLPALAWRLVYGKANLYFQEETAVSFWFGKGRLTILSMTILFDMARLIYDCVFQNVFAILVTIRILACSYQLYDHYWMQKNWIEYFIHGKKRAYLWIRFYASAILLVLYATLDEVQTGIVSHYGTWFHQYVITTFFYAALLASFVFWFLWFLLSSKSSNPCSWRIDRPRFLRYRFKCLRNVTMTLVPLFMAIGVFANIIGDNVSDDLFNNTMQWRYPFMIAGLLLPMAWGIQRFLVLPYDRLMIHRDTIPMAGDFPVVNDVIAGDIIEGNTSQMSRPVVDEPLFTHRSTPRTMTWIPSVNMASKKIHISAPESLETPMTNNNLPVQPQLSQPPPAQPSPLLLDILNSVSQTDNHESADPAQENHQEGSISASLHSANSSSALIRGITDSAHGISGSPPLSNPMPTLAEDNPLSSPSVSTINKLRHRLDIILFGSQVDCTLIPLYSHTFSYSTCNLISILFLQIQIASPSLLS